MMRRLSLTIILPILATGTLFAQEVGPAVAVADANSTVIGRQKETARIDPSLTSPLRSKHSFLNLTATRTDTAAEVQVAHDFATSNGPQNLAFLKVSVPVKKSDTQNTLAGLQGLEGAAKLEIGVNRLWWTPRFKVPTGAEAHRLLFEKWKEECKTYVTGYDLNAVRLCPLSSLPKERQAELIKADPGTLLFQRWKDLCTKENKKADVDGSLCALGSLTAESQAKLIDFGHNPVLAALSGEFGHNSFNYLDATTLQPLKASHDAFSVTAALGVFPLAHGWYYTGLNFKVAHGYQGKDPKNLCLPFGTGGALECADHSVGAPDKSNANSLEFEARYYPSNQLVLNPKISRDFEHRISIIQIPVYFIRDAKGGFDGGVVIGWRSDKKEVTASVFVGQMKNLTNSAQ